MLDSNHAAARPGTQVRSEIQAMELEHEDEMEQLADGVDTKKKEESKEEEINFKTKLGKNIHR